MGLEAVAARAPSEQIQPRLLDPVLGLAARAVAPLVQGLGHAGQIGDDEAWVGASRTVLQPCDDAPVLVSGTGGVGERAEHALLGLLGRVLLDQREFGQLHPSSTAHGRPASYAE